MKIKLKGFKRLLVESALIVFSVLFALFINRYAENQKILQQKQVALERIVQEMKSNRELIANALEIHKVALQNLRQAATNENDSLRIYMNTSKYFDAKVFNQLLNNQPLYPQFPSNTSWQAAMATGIVSEFDYQVVETLSKVYDIQKFFMEETLRIIMGVVFAPIEQESQTINTLSLQMKELVDQENTTIKIIDKALEVTSPLDTTQIKQ